MPRTRKSAARNGPSAQSTLSFNNKSARVTKSSTRNLEDSAAAKKLAEVAQVEAELEDEVAPAPVEIRAANLETEEDEKVDTEEVTTPTTTTKKAKAKPSQTKDERELAAESITDSQVKKYWQAEEAGRLAPRVHQSALSLHEKILRHFDLSSQYGPCIGISRLQRWRRANVLGLNPPLEVLAVLLREDTPKTSQGCGKMAYIDELAGGRVVLVE